MGCRNSVRPRADMPQMNSTLGHQSWRSRSSGAAGLPSSTSSRLLLLMSSSVCPAPCSS